MRSFNLLLLGALTILFNSCEGPQGPPGNANVKAYNYSNINWDDANYSPTTVLVCPSITPEIISNGMVLVYVKYQNSEWQLPWVWADDQGYVENVGAEVSNGQVLLYNMSNDGVPTIYGAVDNVKVVVISGVAGKKELSDEDWTWEYLNSRYPNLQSMNIN